MQTWTRRVKFGSFFFWLDIIATFSLILEVRCVPLSYACMYVCMYKRVYYCDVLYVCCDVCYVRMYVCILYVI